MVKKVQITLPQGKKKKEDEVLDDEDDDDAVRTSVSQDRVTVNCVLRNCFSKHTQYICIALLAYQKGHSGGEDTDGWHDTFSSPSLSSHLPPGPHCGLQGFQ